jgi:hypothetical protein
MSINRKWKPTPDAVDVAFERMGYTMPGTNMNVETAKGIARRLVFDARHEATMAAEKRCCPNCQQRFNSERSVF